MVTNVSSGKQYSNTPGALRQRRWRENKLKVGQGSETAARDVSPIGAASSGPRNTNAPAGPSGPSSPPPPPPFPLHETQPVDVSGEVFTAPAMVLLDGSGTTHEATSDAPAEPVVAPKPEPPPPPPPTTSPKEAAMLARMLTGFVKIGVATIIAKRPELLGVLAGFAPPGMKIDDGIDWALGLYKEAATNLALKYNVRIPYQDEGVVAIGLGVAVWGMFVLEPSEAVRAAQAKNANAPAPDVEVSHV